MTTNVLGFTKARRTSRGNLLAGWLAGGTAEVYTASRPTDADTAITTQTLLVTADRTVAVSGETLAPVGLVTVQSFPAPVTVVVAGETLPPIGLITGGPVQTAIPVTISGETLPPIGLCSVTAFWITER